MKFNPQVFREYDVRGVVAKDFPPAFVSGLGRAIGTFLKRHGAQKIALGRDGRLTSPKLHEQLKEGLLATGVNVLDVGMAPTPLLYFSLFHLNADGGVQITGSHNPPEYNGFKICLGKATIYGAQIQELRVLMENDDFESGPGASQDAPVEDAYIDYLGHNIKLGHRKFTVVLDAGNGVGGPTALRAFKAAGVDVIPLFCDVDGRFPNHHPDPTVEKYLQDLIKTVRQHKASLGIGLDGDADRIGAVDENGNIFWGDQLLLIFARDILRETKGGTFVCDVKCSKVLFDEIPRAGGKVIMWKAGHSLVKAKMKEEHALLGGEMSGHIFFQHRYFGYDDAIYSALRLCEIISRGAEPASRLLADVPRMFSTPEIRVDCPEEIKFAVARRALEFFRQQRLDVNDIDGVRVTWPDGWGLLRASNTQPVLVLRFEATTQKRVDEIQQMFMDKVQEWTK